MLLGPASYMNSQKPTCRIGDTISVEARETTIDGRRFWLAKAVECQDTRVVLVSESNAPAWDQP